MPIGVYSPEGFFFALVVMGVMSLFSSKKKNRRKVSSSRPLTKPSATPVAPDSVEQRNITAMEKVVAEHEGWSAEVIKIYVEGRRRVETCRLLNPGAKVELRCKKGDIKVFAYGEYLDDLLPSSDSHLPRLFEEHIQFDAYLGGREMAFLYDDKFDICSIIVFYKLDGVPPTKVNLC